MGALIVGAGAGLSASLARLFVKNGLPVALAARNPDKLAALCAETGAVAHRCDATQPDDVVRLFDAVAAGQGDPEIVVYNASARAPGPIAELDPAAVANALAVSAFAGFLVAQQAAKRMLPHGAGTILLTGASASVKGYVKSAAFAMGKFALRGLAQSMARELAPQGIHVAHFVIDGGIRSGARADPASSPDSLLDPDDHRGKLLARGAAEALGVDVGDGAAALGRAILAALALLVVRLRRNHAERAVAAWFADREALGG